VPKQIIDEMPTMRQVEEAPPYQIVVWNHYLRQTMMNEELIVVKAIARRYEELNEMLRTGMVNRARREYES
jgi:hypothetical protein